MKDNNPPLLLAPEEVAALTGFKSAGRQRRWLTNAGWRFVMSGSGKPVIARKYAETMLGCSGDHDAYERPGPNFGALLRAI